MLAGLLLLLTVDTVTAAPAPAPKAEIVGLWKGRSICTKVEAAESCNDETVAYNFIDVNDKPETVSLKAGRIADNTVLPMYAIYVSYRPDESRWTAEFTRGGTHGLWSYVVKGDQLTGTLVLLPGRTVVRNVTAKRVTRAEMLAP